MIAAVHFFGNGIAGTGDQPESAEGADFGVTTVAFGSAGCVAETRVTLARPLVEPDLSLSLTGGLAGGVAGGVAAGAGAGSVLAGSAITIGI